jgi:uncharacterized protein (TIGR04222 family)
LSGPEFLLVYAIGLMVAIIGRFVARRLTIGGSSDGAMFAAGRLGHYEAAYLSGSARAAVDAAVVVLLHEGRIGYSGGRLIPMLATARSVRIAQGIYREVARPIDQHPLELAVEHAVSAQHGMTLRHLRRTVRGATTNLAKPLYELGLVIRPRARALASTFSAVPLLVLLVAGTLRVIWGAQSGRPLAHLAILLTITLVFAFYTLPIIFARRTSKGNAALEFLRQKNTALRITAVSAPQQLHAHEAALGFALFGSAVLAGGFAELSCDIQQLGSAVDKDLHSRESRMRSWESGSSSCGGGGGCGSASCSAGCGGGGCGGCGGGE